MVYLFILSHGTGNWGIMKTNKIFIAILLLILFSACIDRYFIEENEDISPNIVIEGTIMDICEPQEIVISASSSTNWPKFKPYTGCVVNVIDNEDNVFKFEESDTKPGHYFCAINEDQLITGKQFKLIVLTPDESQYESSFEELLPSPEIDSLYSKLLIKPTVIPEVTIDGLQFYLNFEASDYFGTYYRYILEETYEYHSFWPIKDFIDENGRYVEGPIDFSKFVCYKTSILDDILTLSTQSFSQNKYNGAELIFVDDHTQRLLYNYRLLVKQLSLDQKAYNYWEKLRNNNRSSGGLFTKQPSIIEGNLKNVNDSSEKVLGYFGVSSVSEKEIILKKVEELKFKDMFVCTPFFFKYTDLPLEPRPLYSFWATDPADGTYSKAWSAPECFDCTILGGVVDKPTFFE